MLAFDDWEKPALIRTSRLEYGGPCGTVRDDSLKIFQRLLVRIFQRSRDLIVREHDPCQRL